MKKKTILLSTLFFGFTSLMAQESSEAGNWKTWFISSGRDFRLPDPASYKNEIATVIELQKNLNAVTRQHMNYWNAGAPGYRWQEMINKIWTVDTGRYAILANLLLGTATYDAIIAAWNSKYSSHRPRPYQADKRIKTFTVKAESPSYPCEYSVAAGVAVTIMQRFFPHLKDSVNRMAKQLMDARITSGMAFPSDAAAGFALGKRIAEKEMEMTKDFVTTASWDGKIPDKPGSWKGKFAMFPTAGQNKTIVLISSNEFRPAPPPDFAKEMEELKNYKQSFRTLSNAFYWANHSWFSDYVPRKIFELNLHLDPPRAAYIQSVVSVANWDGFIATWDAKYAYWGIRPNQFDTTFKPAILVTPPFPGYPSGHAALSAVQAEIYSYFFPEDSAIFRQKAKDAAESRFQAGIHFRSDNEVALELGKKIGAKVIQRVKEMEMKKTE